MEVYSVKDLTFTYPEKNIPALHNLSFSIQSGQFVVLCGLSGSGKTTLLRQLKPSLAPHGARSGELMFAGKPLGSLDLREQSRSIGFVMQSPDNQIVCDKVWHELAFGLESLGMDTPAIRRRVAEMASFFGIQTWFHMNVNELSGGQKQILNLASIMAMQPIVLILDEPTGWLDPIAAAEFLDMVGKINRELGVTVIITEHRLGEVFPRADRVLVMDQGNIIADGSAKEIGMDLRGRGHGMFVAMPVPMRVYAAVDSAAECPVTVREGKDWLDKQIIRKVTTSGDKRVTLQTQQQLPLLAQKQGSKQSTQQQGTIHQQLSQSLPALEFDQVWFKYEKNLPDVLKGLSLKAYPQEICAILGGNGTGKSTALSLAAGLYKPYRGRVRLGGEEIGKIAASKLFDRFLGVLPQNPQAVFVKSTVESDLLEMLNATKLSKEKKEQRVAAVANLCQISRFLDAHPYDLSGGEQQRAALAKVLLLNPVILLLDEPTKGLDGEFKQVFAGILADLAAQGVCVVMVSHDIEFCAEYAHRCALFFDGGIVSEGEPRVFFSGNSFYTTAANRMARHLLPEAVTANDVIHAIGGEPYRTKPELPQGTDAACVDKPEPPEGTAVHCNEKQELPKGLIVGCEKEPESLYNVADKPELPQGTAVECAGKPELPEGTAMNDNDRQETPQGETRKKLSKRTLLSVFIVFLAIPLTIAAGSFFPGEREYYFVSMLIIIETMLPFILVFESRKPQPRELIVIAVLSAIGVVGRAAFFMLPQFKPVVAIVIIAGVALGGEAGFLTGVVTGFVSNMFFGQGPWTPWQMFAYGIVGFFAGILFRKGVISRGKLALCVYGGLSTLLIYGPIMNLSNIFIFQNNPTKEMYYLALLQGLPFDLIHATATVVFLLILSRVMLQKLQRIKVKYGLME